jgi:hypothetical protein
MDKKLLIDSYLEGKHPIEQEKWELPSESELDRDEALFDALLAERPSKSPLKGDFTSPLRGGRVGSWRGRRRLQTLLSFNKSKESYWSKPFKD